MTGRVLELLGPSTGGIRRHVAALTAGLVDIGWDVTVAGPPGVVDGLGVEPSAVRRVDVPGGLSPTGLAAAVRQLRALGRFDLVHAHGLKAGWVAVLSRTGAPVVVTVHNIVLDDVAGRSAAVMRFLERRLVRRADHVIGASPAIVDQFRGDVTPGRITFVLPVAPAAVAHRDRSEVRAELGADDGAVLTVVVARLHPQKDLPMFVRAWRTVSQRWPSARAAIVGEGPDQASLQALIDELGVADTLRLAGPSASAIEQLAAADIVALTSRWEAVPLVAVEAVQLGRPVVSTRVGVVEDLVGDGGVVVDVGAESAFAAALGDLVGSAEARRAAAEISRRRGTLIYGSDALVGEVAAVYEEVLRR